MCTLSIVPLRSPSGIGVRLVCNRDESRSRPPAVPPELRHFAARRALLPIDPVGGGTWIATSDAPLALTLMNVYPRALDIAELVARARSRRPTSRGTIIPQALAASTLGEALARVQSLDLGQFEPFRLVVADLEHVAEAVWAEGRFEVTEAVSLRGPRLFTSSGLGDEVVAGPRRKLFEELFLPDAAWPAVQDVFHRHEWPGREFASVWMTRPEARTVSLTAVEMHPGATRMAYYARRDDQSDAREAHELVLPISSPAAHAAG
jgi:hypothetical protein